MTSITSSVCCPSSDDRSVSQRRLWPHSQHASQSQSRIGFRGCIASHSLAYAFFLQYETHTRPGGWGRQAVLVCEACYLLPQPHQSILTVARTPTVQLYPLPTRLTLPAPKECAWLILGRVPYSHMSHLDHYYHLAGCPPLLSTRDRIPQRRRRRQLPGNWERTTSRGRSNIFPRHGR